MTFLIGLVICGGIAGWMVTALILRLRIPPRLTVDHDNLAARWTFRAAMFMGAFAFCFFVAMTGMGLVFRAFPDFTAAFHLLPLAVRQASTAMLTTILATPLTVLIIRLARRSGMAALK